MVRLKELSLKRNKFRLLWGITSIPRKHFFFFFCCYSVIINMMGMQSKKCEVQGSGILKVQISQPALVMIVNQQKCILQDNNSHLFQTLKCFFLFSVRYFTTFLRIRMIKCSFSLKVSWNIFIYSWRRRSRTSCGCIVTYSLKRKQMQNILE